MPVVGTVGIAAEFLGVTRSSGVFVSDENLAVLIRAGGILDALVGSVRNFKHRDG
jgi:hypothetical protein